MARDLTHGGGGSRWAIRALACSGLLTQSAPSVVHAINIDHNIDHSIDHTDMTLSRSAGPRAAQLIPDGMPDGLTVKTGDDVAPAAQPSAAPLAPDLIDGRDFKGIRWALAPVTGELKLQAAKAWAWSVPARNGGVTTQRLLLEGTVRVHLGEYAFDAKKAAVWMERLGSADGVETYQVYIYFQEVGTPSAEASLAVQAPRLPVRATISTGQGVQLQADLLMPSAPTDAFIAESEAALARSLREAAGLPPLVEEPARSARPRPERPRRVVIGEPARQVAVQPRPGREPLAPAVTPPERIATPAPGEPAPPAPAVAESSTLPRPRPVGEPIFTSDGVITLSAGGLTLVSGPDENAVMATNGVIVLYSVPASGRALEISAQRAVVFLDPAPLRELTTFKPEQVRGVYLEGDVVANDGRYVVRGPRVYYDVQRNKAVLLDGVFWTYDQQRGLPLYVRAEAIRQESTDQFQAESARLSTSAFFTPELSLGVSKVTIARQVRTVAEPGLAASDPPRREGRTEVNARGIRLEGFGLPFFYLPRFRGDPEDVALKDVRFENRSGSGAAVRTTWNLYSLLGLPRSSDVSLDLLADYYIDRGPAVGAQAEWQTTTQRGQIFSYLIPSDSGTDLLKTGAESDRDNDTRGLILGEQRWKLDERWTVFAEGAYISDENLIDGYFEELAETRREFATRALLLRREENTSFALEAKGTANDFIANEYLLQSRGYSVSRLPEATYTRLADDLLEGISPGLVSWTHEYRVGHLQLALDEIQARQRGFITDAASQRTFGINASESLAESLRRSGYFESSVFRFDTRQELSAQLAAGPLILTPFAVGRVTAYDNDFDLFSPQEQETTRLWGALGVRVATAIQRVFGVESRFWNLHRLRHIIEPSLTVWHGGTNIDRVDLPVYDDDVESLASGSTARFGILQTWQTERGAPGAWTTVDVVRLNTEVVFSSRDADRESPIGRFFEFRPELSNVGEFASSELIWNVSDAVSASGSLIYDFERSQLARTTAGLIVRHEPGATIFTELRTINSQDSVLWDIGAAYELSNKYTIGVRTSYDTLTGEFQTLTTSVQRRSSNLLVGVGFSYNNISGETSIGFLLRPVGARGSVGVSGLGSEAGQSSAAGGPG